MKRLLRKLGKLLFKEYKINCLYSIDEKRLCKKVQPPPGFELQLMENREEVSHSGNEEIKTTAWCLDVPGFCYAACREGELSAVCHFWPGPDASRARSELRFGKEQAYLVQITVAEKYRNLGIGSALLSHAAGQTLKMGYKELVARVWHSNLASRRMFTRAGWQKNHTVLDMQLKGFKRPVRIAWPSRKSAPA